MMQKIVNAKVKTGLKFNTMIQDLDIHCSRDYYLYNNTFAKVQIQRTTVQDSSPKKPKSKDIKPNRVKVAESIEQNKRDKNRRTGKKNWNNIGEYMK